MRPKQTHPWIQTTTGRSRFCPRAPGTNTLSHAFCQWWTKQEERKVKYLRNRQSSSNEGTIAASSDRASLLLVPTSGPPDRLAPSSVPAPAVEFLKGVRGCVPELAAQHLFGCIPAVWTPDVDAGGWGTEKRSVAVGGAAYRIPRKLVLVLFVSGSATEMPRYTEYPRSTVGWGEGAGPAVPREKGRRARIHGNREDRRPLLIWFILFDRRQLVERTCLRMFRYLC
jgi:hypothetical protein